VAEKYQEKGFVNAKALLGGVKAWQEAGLRVIPPR
jgi:rhodanese-related sulfurtransferase